MLLQQEGVILHSHRLSAALRLALASAMLIASAWLAGCHLIVAAPSSSVAQPGVALQGHVHGGQQPVIGASVYLYAAGSGGDGTAATSLLHSTTTSVPTPGATAKDANGNYFATTDANGSFSITGDYTCPAQATEVYLVAVGGNPGLSLGKNAGLAEMAALGLCSSLQSSTSIFVDEVTTVGSVAALYPYMTSLTNLGSGSNDAAALTTAFATVNEFTNTTTGTAPGTMLPVGFYASSNEINTLSDVLAACVNSAGGAAGDGSSCGNLYQLTKPASGPAPTDTIGALIQILKNPTQNVSALYGLIGSVVPYQPMLSSAPSNWSLTIVPAPGTPILSVAAGTYTGTITLSITDSDPTAIIYYTSNGSVPNSSSTVYSGPFTVAATQTVKAVAIESGRAVSAVASAAYTISTPTTPYIASVSAVLAQPTQTITISGSGFGSITPYSGDSNYIVIHDVTDNNWSAGYTGSGDTITLSISSWTNNSIVITGFGGAYGSAGMLRIGDQLTVQVWNPSAPNSPAYCSAIVVGGGASTCGSAPQVFTPVFSPAGGTYSSAQSVTISDAIGGAAIYYTLTGATPTTSSTPYTGPFMVSASETINAIAVASGYANSAAASATYTITNSTTPVITSISAVQAQQTQTITITGSGFGTQAAYNGNSNYIMTFDVTGGNWSAGQGGDLVHLGVTSWTNNQIVLSGFTGYYGYNNWILNNGDQLTFAVWNAPGGTGPVKCSVTVGGGASTCGTPSQSPLITSVSAVQAAQTQTITITGTGFGNQAAYNGDSDDIILYDVSAGNWSAGHTLDTVTFNVASWTNTQIVLSGFTGAYGTNGFTISNGDTLSLNIWNAPSEVGPAQCNLLVGGGTNTCGFSSLPFPVITSVTAIQGGLEKQELVINGSGFGTQPAPYQGDSNYIEFIDLSAGWEAGNTGLYNGLGTADPTGLAVLSWTDTQIQLEGFTGMYGGPIVLTTGDLAGFIIWNTSGVPGLCTNIAIGGGPTTCQ